MDKKSIYGKVACFPRNNEGIFTLPEEIRTGGPLSAFVPFCLPATALPVTCLSSYLTVLFSMADTKLHTGGHQISCQKGNLFLFRQGCEFQLEYVQGGELYFLYYNEQFFSTAFLSQIADCPIIYDFFTLDITTDKFLYFDCQPRSPVYDNFMGLLFEAVTDDALSEKNVLLATIILLSNLNRIHQQSLVVSESNMMPEYFCGRVLSYLVEHYATATLANTAAHFNYSPAYFSTLFQKKMKVHFSHKLLEIRMEKARRLLISTDFSIHQIFESVGFEEKSYFYKAFKKFYGTTPLQYRKAVRSKNSPA